MGLFGKLGAGSMCTGVHYFNVYSLRTLLRRKRRYVYNTLLHTVNASFQSCNVFRYVV